MSAPVPQVRIHTLASPAGWAYWTCEGCGHQSIAKAGEISLRHARNHSDVCKRLALARLQARWDARDKALRALIERWRAYGHARIRHAADELERAIGERP